MTDGPASVRPHPTEVSPADSLARRLDDPAVAAALNNLLDHADLMAMMMIGLDGFVSRSEVIGDAMIESLNELRGAAEANKPETPVDPAAIASSLLALSGALPKMTPAITRMADQDVAGRLLDAGLADPPMIDLMTTMATAVRKGAADAADHPIEITGPVSMYRQLKDPDVVRGLGFTLSILKAVGHELDGTR